MRGATRGLPRRSPILVLLSPSTFNCGVLMGSGALVLLWNRYSDRRIFRISRFHPGALVEAVLVNFWDEISGGLRRRGRGQTSVRVE
uniref:Uncharacterized protein n=1 Tax=Salix viminalis TaxID=40686 RepID=A0A6N2NFQ2_SALVM